LAVVELTHEEVRRAIVDAGFEIYRVDGSEIRVAERIRVHLMDSGVRVVAGSDVEVVFTVRAQRSDDPTATPDDLFAKVRSAIGESAGSRGFAEASSEARPITNPVDAESVLDVWHEVTFSKRVSQLDELVEEVKWAAALAKCVTG
jgi:hypothetical protein